MFSWLITESAMAMASFLVYVRFGFFESKYAPTYPWPRLIRLFTPAMNTSASSAPWFHNLLK